ncbi:hypothetical protein R3P38DRAFT_2815433 [Favolaschia claudopus]|uniref:Uncharacterized protein n=1 Tax=Favolaschia claudopus TaxID=2862362 RepID=A0AAV9Z151_9AGAR
MSPEICEVGTFVSAESWHWTKEMMVVEERERSGSDRPLSAAVTKRHTVFPGSDSCGQSAFARVTRDWLHQDQALPVELASRLRRRDGVLPEVKGLTLDTDFHSTELSQAGPVNFAIHGLTSSLPESPVPQRRSRLSPASLPVVRYKIVPLFPFSDRHSKMRWRDVRGGVDDGGEWGKPSPDKREQAEPLRVSRKNIHSDIALKGYAMDYRLQRKPIHCKHWQVPRTEYTRWRLVGEDAVNFGEFKNNLRQYYAKEDNTTWVHHETHET